MNQVSDRSRVLMSSHAEKSYLDIEFQDGDWLVFGKKKACLSQEVGFICQGKSTQNPHVIFDSEF
jgi:tRNA(Leu) C34 or U34 (ribose-2'-O)-methylase TrmL